MARPKHSPEARREHHIGVRFSTPEYKKITAESGKLGVTLSSYIRAKALRGYVSIPKYARIDNEHIGQLSKLGGLLKKMHNENGGIYKLETAAILDEIRAILLKIKIMMEPQSEQPE
jgi:hypothetical protein